MTTVFLNELNLKGCHSCFACKLKSGGRYGKCSLKDDLTPILDAITAADCIVLASPIYLMDMNSSAKVFLERLCYSLGSYEKWYRSLATKNIVVATIYAINTLMEYAPVSAMDNVDMFIGHILSTPHRICAYNTYQFSNYSKYVVEVFDEVEKQNTAKKSYRKICKRHFN